MVIFESSRLQVKPITEEHKTEFTELLTAEEIITMIPQQCPSEENVNRKFKIATSFNNNIKETSVSLLGVFEQHKNELIGIVGFLTNNDEDRELGYRFRKPFWGKGYASEITKEAINYSFKELNLPKITADVWSENKASIKVLSKYFKFVKEFYNESDKCYDKRFELLKEDWELN